MCHSPIHAKHVLLLMNTQTVDIIMQVHCIYNYDFEMCKQYANLTSLCPHNNPNIQCKFDKKNINTHPTLIQLRATIINLKIKTCYQQGTSQDVHFDLILWYV